MITQSRIVLTGGGGMVGRNLLETAAAQSIEIIAPSSRELDLMNQLAVARYLDYVKPDVIIHAAGRVGGIQANMREPVLFLVQNWDMGRNLILASRNAGVKQLINLGSSCMYPRNSPDALREEDVLTGALEPTNEGYAIAKCAVARLCHYIQRESPDCQYKTLIPCNLYGRFDKFDPSHSHLIPAVIHKLHRAIADGISTVDIWGDGTARREFMYAGDLANAILRAVECFDTLPNVMNVGVGHDFAVNDYYRVGAQVVGYTGTFDHDLTKPVGMMRKLTDVSRAKEWGWHPQTSLEDGIRATYAYYLESGVANVLSAS